MVDPRKARARLAALLLIFVVQPTEAHGGLEQIVYPRPQDGDSDISKFVRTVTVLTRKTLAASQRCALSGTHLKGILKLTNNANLRRKIKSAVIEASGLSNAAANKHFSVSLSDKDKMEVYAKLEELAEIDSEYQRLAECEDEEFLDAFPSRLEQHPEQRAERISLDRSRPDGDRVRVPLGDAHRGGC